MDRSERTPTADIWCSLTCIQTSRCRLCKHEYGSILEESTGLEKLSFKNAAAKKHHSHRHGIAFSNIRLNFRSICREIYLLDEAFRHGVNRVGKKHSIVSHDRMLFRIIAHAFGDRVLCNIPSNFASPELRLP